MTARQGTPADADELVRLRAVMLRSMSTTGWNDDWREPTRQLITTRLAEADTHPTLVAFVVDRPDGGLAACALGAVEHRLGNPANPTGRLGYVFSVATDPDMRRRGYSRSCLTALLDWYRAHHITTVDLRASPDGEHLYRSLGFNPTKDPAMRINLAIRVAD
ncbi:GNAT family N-acetyltransferase [Micromonosporaceae bacterium Da 78-11]